MDYVIYVGDTETTGLDSRKNDVIEISLIRFNDGVQKTWSLKPFNADAAEPAALRVNGHKLEDLKLETKYGRDTYQDAAKTIIEIENWLEEDGVPKAKRILCGHNVAFDLDMLTQLWVKCESKDSFPFGYRTLDTMQLEFFMDMCKDSMADSYSLSNVVKKYGIVNSKAHSAEADTLATKLVFQEQVAKFKEYIKKSK